MCEPKIIDPPPLIGPNCNKSDHAGYCMELPGGTCLIFELDVNCIKLEFVNVTDKQ